MQRSKLVMALTAASVMVTSMLCLPQSKAATQEVVGNMQIFHLDKAGGNNLWSRAMGGNIWNRGQQANTASMGLPAALVEQDANVSQEFVSEIQRDLRKIPMNLLVALSNSGYRVIISESLVNAVPAARNQQVRGYQAHSTWDTVYGMFNRTTRRVVMAEKAMQPDPTGRTAMMPLRDQQRRDGILRHEFGHAVDQYLGNLSHSPAFIAAYNRGVKSVSPYEARVLNYYLQPGDAGREETFAELFASLNDVACDRNSDILLRNHFPELVNLIRDRVAKVAA